MKSALSFAIVIALLAASPLTARADDADNTNAAADISYSHPIIGVWDATVTIKNCATGDVMTEAHALNAFFPGGMLMDANTMPSGMRGQSFGAWHAAWHGTPDGSWIIDFSRRNLPPLVTARMRFYRYGDDGNVAGTNVIDRKIQVAADGLSYTGTASGHILDNTGKELMHVCTTETAVRVE